MRTSFATLILGLLICLPARAEFQAGAAVVDVTPEEFPVFVNGGMLSRSVETVHTPVNARAIALYKKFGFEVEGKLKRYAFRDGAYVDAYAMARLR